MAEYIEREATIDFVKNNTPTLDKMTTIGCVERALYIVPAADVQDVRHGRWVQDFDQDYYCSKCGAYPVSYVEDFICPPYCPNCGAKMDGKGDA